MKLLALPIKVGAAIGTAYLFFGPADDLLAPYITDEAIRWWGVLIGLVVVGWRVAEAITDNVSLDGILAANPGIWDTPAVRGIVGKLTEAVVVAASAYAIYRGLCYGFVRGYLAAYESGIRLPVPSLASFQVTSAALAFLLRYRIEHGIAVITRPWRRMMRQRRFGTAGSARYETQVGEWGMRWKPGMWKLGHSLHNGMPIGIKDDGHITISAANGEGKSLDCLIENVVHWPVTTIVHDPKLQIYSVTAQAKRDQGFQVILLDPMGITTRLAQEAGEAQPVRSRWNFMDELDPRQKEYQADVAAYGSAIVTEDNGDKSQFFYESSKNFVNGAIDYVKRRKGNGPRNLGAVCDLLHAWDWNDAVLAEMEALGGAAKTLATSAKKESKDTLNNIRLTVLTHIEFLGDPSVRDMLSSSDFSMRDIHSKKLAVFYGIQPHHQLKSSRLNRLFITGVLIGGYTGKRDRKSKHQIAVIIDEAFSLGKMSLLSNAVSNIRGYGLKLAMVWQTLTQPVTLYGKEADNFIANSGQVQIWGNLDLPSSEYLSKRLGKSLTYRKTAEGVQATGVAPFREANEINITVGKQNRCVIAFARGYDPLLLGRRPYHAELAPHEYSPDPYERKGWREEALDRLINSVRRIFRRIGL